MKLSTKILTTIAFTLTAGVSTVTMAHTKTVIVATDNSIGTELCVTAAKGNKFKMRAALKSAHLRKAFVVENVQCNEQSFLSFVEQHGKNPTEMANMLTNGKYQGQVNIIDLASL